MEEIMKKKIAVLILAVSMILTFVIKPVAATTDDKLLDVVLVLDQSGSMKTNDPDGLMKEAAQTFITMLPDNSRANIITFNRSRSMWQNGLTELNDDRTTRSATDWINDVEYTGDTDLSNAIGDAVEMFDVSDNRVHAILVFSDGRNDFGFDRNEEVAADERLNDALALAKNNGIQIYCIGYGDEMVNTNDQPYQKLDSVAIANSANRITTQTAPTSINDYFNTVIAELMDANLILIKDNKIKIASNVKEANISITCNDDIGDAGIKLFDPDDNEINFNNNQDVSLHLYQHSAVIKLYDPDPGTYTIESNKDIAITTTYIPYYQYQLNTTILDSAGQVVDHISNGVTLTINSTIQQNGKNVTTVDTYDNVKAQATITPLDTKESKTVSLSYQNGSFVGEAILDHVALYNIDILVESDSFRLTDSIEIQADKQPISLDIDKLKNQVLDKTFKSSVTKEIPIATLNGIVNDVDDVGFQITNATSTNQDNVTVQLNDDGLILTGTSWGSSTVTLTYEDGLGNRVDASFSVKVNDVALVIFFASIPFIIGLLVLIIALIIIRQSRYIKGTFTVNSITYHHDIETFSISNQKSYSSNIFLKRKKTLATGISLYINDLYHEAYNDRIETLNNLLNQNQAIKKGLDAVKFIGTYLGRNGLKLVVKDANVSYSNNLRYGVKIIENWKDSKDFVFYLKDETGLEICIEGSYTSSIIKKINNTFDDTKIFNDTTNDHQSFDEFDDFNDF